MIKVSESRSIAYRNSLSFSDSDFCSADECRFCGGAVKSMGIFKEAPRIQWVRCTQCNAVSYDKILKQEKLHEYYANYHYWTDEKSSAKVTFSDCTKMGRHLCKVIRKYHGKTMQNTMGGGYNVLDFGGGDGSLAYCFARELSGKDTAMKINITVVDYNQTVCVSENGNICIEHKDDIYQLAGKKYDFIIASAVLEHLPNLNSDFKQLTSSLKENGLLYIRTPYRYPLYRLVKKWGIELDMLFPEHLWDLGKRFYEYLGSATMKLIVSRPSIVELSFKTDFFPCLAAHVLKMPFHLFHNWPYVGGWEAVFEKQVK